MEACLWSSAGARRDVVVARVARRDGVEVVVALLCQRSLELLDVRHQLRATPLLAELVVQVVR